MTDMRAQDEAWIKVLAELRTTSGVDVSNEVLGHLESEAELESLAAGGGAMGVSLDPELVECSPRFSEIGCQWGTVTPHTLVSGEFFLTPVLQAVREEAPDFSSSLHTETERAVGSQLRIIDEAPYTGSGSYAALRVQPRVADPEIWFAHHLQGLWRMDLNYCEYMRTLTVTKGCFDWQHLFTDAPLKSAEFSKSAQRLRNMLDVLPRIFPDHDYAPLHARLAERLR
ncbi:hypothetical protein [Streptomyces sp. HC307]|uniref:hypothetical protein n=1 Tax=Streptomyces flavusporus TaxID=3385496 RepID=UPI0039173A73